MPIIGTVEVCRSFAFHIAGDAHPQSGMAKFESKDFFCSYKASCTAEDAAQVSADLFATAERDVLAAADYHANFLTYEKQEVKAEIETPREVNVSFQNGNKSTVEYIVEEKAPETPTAQAQAPDYKAMAKAKADALKATGLTSADLKAYVDGYFPKDHKPSQADYCEAFTKMQAQIDSKQKPEVYTDKTVFDAANQVATKFPMWPPDLVKLGALWCADQVKDAAALDAFLISLGAIGFSSDKKAALLAITRHMALSQGSVLIEYSKKTGDPLSKIEADINLALKHPGIRFAVDRPNVYTAFEILKGRS